MSSEDRNSGFFNKLDAATKKIGDRGDEELKKVFRFLWRLYRLTANPFVFYATIWRLLRRHVFKSRRHAVSDAPQRPRLTKDFLSSVQSGMKSKSNTIERK